MKKNNQLTRNMMLQCWAFHVTRGLGWMIFTILVYSSGLNIIHLGIAVFVLMLLMIPFQTQKKENRSVLGMFLCMMFEQLFIAFGLFYITQSLFRLLVMFGIMLMDMIIFYVIYKRKPSKPKHKKT
jgi:hypothetical protein